MSKEELQQAIKEARPKLSTVAPLTAAICWGFVVVNIVLGLGMYFIYTTTVVPIAVASILSYESWGLIFFGLGIITAGFIFSNNWKATRNAQLAGLLIKSIWAIALIVRCFEEPRTILITAVWLFFAYIQAVTYIHFLPIPKGNNNEHRD